MTLSSLSPQALFGIAGLTQSCPKLDLGAGPPRAADPAATFQRIRPYFKQAGLTRVANVTYLDRHDIPVTVAIRPNSKSMAVSSGKSLTMEGAMVSGAMEALELYVAEEASLPTFLSAHCDLETAKIPSALLPLRKHSIFHPSRPERWCMAWDMIQREEVAVPFEWVTMDLCFSPLRESIASFRTDSNGLASGNTLLEAISSALLETIERDAVTLHHYSTQLTGGRSTCVKLESLSTERLQNLLERLDRAGLDMYLYDCTCDTGVPVFLAYCCDRETPRQVAGGYGAHLDPAVAAERALIEAVQGRTVVVAGARDDIFQLYYDLRRLNDAQSFDAWKQTNPPHLSLSTQNRSTPTFEGDIEVLLSQLQAIGIRQVLVVDLTPKDWDVAVVRVLVPGLEGYYRFNRPGPRALTYLSQLQSNMVADGAGVHHFPAGGAM